MGLLATRRERVVAVTIAPLDPPVLAMSSEFRSLVAADFASLGNRFGLSVEVPAGSLTAVALDIPSPIRIW